MNTNTLNRLKQLIERSHRPLLTAHIRLDGDALGSELALYYALRDMGKDPVIINDSPIPRVYKFLVREANVRVFNPESTTPDSAGGFDLVISVDTPAKERLGGVRQLFSDSTPIISIDHHLCNGDFGIVNWVDTSKCSTGEMVYEFLRSAGCKITPRIAEALYVAIVTDTGRFTNPNTSSETLRVAAQLVDCGADPTEIGNHLY
ncbi:MAG: DHH family phosphoesterase, partial [Candidatus Brocadiales bacterium]